jgi:glycosyltransferase involved in cell wall biosynthesis
LHLAGFLEPPAFPEQNIIAYKWKPLDEIADFLRQMDVMIVPSRDENVMRETFSQSAVQGMLSGLPLIVSALPVLTEKINNGGGLVFRDSNELTHAMSKLAADSELRRTFGEQGRKTALERYVWSTRVFADEFIKPYL